MNYRHLPNAIKLDLRSTKGARIQRGFTSRFMRVITLILIDVIAISLAWKLALFYGAPFNSYWADKESFLLLILTLEVGMITVKGLYQPGRHRRNYFDLLQVISLAAIFLLVIAFTQEPNSFILRPTFLLFWFLSIIFICTVRYIFDVVITLLRNQGIIRHSVFLITEDEDKNRHIKIIEQENCYSVQGVANPNCLDLINREITLDSLRQQGIEEVFVSWDAIKNRLYVCWNFQSAGIILRILPNQTEVLCPKSVLWMVGQVPCMTIPTSIIAGSEFWMKRCFDFCCSIVLILLLSPVYLIIAILIKLDSPGPVFFKQNRIGLHGQNFQIWKFRTMVSNAEKLQAVLEANNEIKDGILFKIKNDPRITKIGKFLRLYSLDELPQLFNVLIGQMSLVGPRPLPTRDVEKFKKKHFIRQEVLPGISGLWQVSGRSDISNFEEGVQLDMAYIENWSFWLDLKILFLTIKVVMQKKGAY